MNENKLRGIFSDGENRLELFDDGFIYEDSEGQRKYFWPQLVSYTQAKSTNLSSLGEFPVLIETNYLLSLTLDDGTELVFDNKYEEIEELAYLLQELTTGPLIENILRQIQEGGVVGFGPFVANVHGLNRVRDNTLIPWKELYPPTIKDEFITFRGIDYQRKQIYPLEKYLVSQVPNAFTLGKLISLLNDFRDTSND